MRKNNKRALIVSVLSLLLCVSMLVGSTMAWFTDNASTAVNTIQSGTLDIRLLDKDGNNMDGQALTFTDANGNTEILWEPGCTFITQPVCLWNYSNLSLALKVSISGFSGDVKLQEALEIKIVDYDKIRDDSGNLKPFDEIDESYLKLYSDAYDGFPLQSWQYGLQADWTTKSEGVQTAHPGVGQPKPIENICIVAHMDENAGNEYQGLTLTGAGLLFQAAQLADEYDSYGNEYDKDAEYDNSIHAAPATAQKIIDEAKAGDVIALSAGTYENLVVSEEINSLTFVGQEGTIVKGITVDTATDAPTTGKTFSGLTFKNIDFEGKGIVLDFSHGTPYARISNVTIENCTFTGTGTSKDQNIIGNRLVDVGADSPGSNKLTNIVIKNCTVTNAFQGIRLGALYGDNVISGNTISNVGHNAITLRTVQGGTTLVSGNTISNGGDRAFRASTIADSAVVKIENNVITNTEDPDDGSNWKSDPTNATITFTGNTVDGAAWNG